MQNSSTELLSFRDYLSWHNTFFAVSVRIRMESMTTNTESPIPSSPRPPQAFREACEECHRRKIRCVSNNGACQYCVASGRACTFHPRSVMGRPRKHKLPKTGGSSRTSSPPTAGESEHQYKPNRRQRQHRPQHHYHRKQVEEECSASVISDMSPPPTEL